MSQIKDKFNFFVPFSDLSFTKGGAVDDDDADKIWIEGVCSSSEEDLDGEILEPSGFDFKPLITKGFFNWDHQSKKTSAALVGEPTEAKVVDGGANFFIRGFLYGKLEEAQNIATLARVLEKSSKTRKLGFSIEGSVLEKDPLNPKRIKRARLTGCAITPLPKNPNTLLKLMKGEYAEAFQKPDSDELEMCPKCNKEAMSDGKCTECGYVEKAMEANINLIPEDVEHKTDPKVGLQLTKSEVYDRIISRYATDNEKTIQIYSLIKSVQNSFPMKSNATIGGKVSEEALLKAFTFLDQAIQKGEQGMEESEEENEDESEESKEPKAKQAKEKREGTEKPEEAPPKVEKGEKKKDKEPDDDDEMFDKAAEMVGDMMKSGKSKDESVDEMEKGGIPRDIASAVYDAAISDANANKDGGKVTQHSSTEGRVEKSVQDGEFGVSMAETNELLKSLSTGLDKKFGALGTIMKSLVEQNDLLKGTVTTLQKSLTETAERLGKVENTSQGSKSVTSAKQVERFAKSENAENKEGLTTLSVSNTQQRGQICKALMDIAIDARATGTPNMTIEKAASELELAKSMSRDVLPALRARGIHVVE